MVIYLKSKRRRPVWIGPRPVGCDMQGAIPDGWCSGCGTEVFDGGLCPRCRRKERIDEISM